MLRRLCSLGSLLLLFGYCLPSAAATPAPPVALDAGSEPVPVTVVVLDDAIQDSDAIGSGWWQERKQRTLELVMCALSGANVTYMLVAGIPGAGGGLSLAIAVVGVLTCL